MLRSRIRRGSATLIAYVVKAKGVQSCFLLTTPGRLYSHPARLNGFGGCRCRAILAAADDCASATEGERDDG
jgi:hypothetical protein